MQNNKLHDHLQNRRSHPHSFQDATGPVAIRLTNDYIFKRILEKNETVLRALIGSLLHRSIDEITHLHILNPIMPGDAITDRSVVLDVNVEINHGARMDLEMQVVNYKDWPERSLYYACRNYLNLARGQDYDLVAPSWQIGFLDYTIFEDHPSFYSTYKLTDTADHYVYTDKFSIGVVDMSKINLATEKDRQYNIDRWAKLFKAQTWEDIKMLAKQDVYISKAGETYFEISADEHERQLAEAREDVLRRERATKRREKELLRSLDAAHNELAKKDQRIAEKDQRIAEDAQRIAEHEQRIAELEALLAEKEK